ncbi:MAG: hypothetical protein ACI95C_002637 [Pseudohongiellaceae bacterium]|jgi:hypothetical protein
MLRLSAFAVCFFLASPVVADPIQNLDKIGSAKLRVFLWNIYESTLYSPSGEFEGIEPGLALEIEYRRNISKKAFIDYTREEWQKQSLYNAESERWLTEIRNIFPSVKKGDRLILKVADSLTSEFYFNDEFIGAIDNADFTREFLAIWLSEQSSYPELRNQLIGSTN